MAEAMICTCVYIHIQLHVAALLPQGTCKSHAVSDEDNFYRMIYFLSTFRSSELSNVGLMNVNRLIVRNATPDIISTIVGLGAS